MERFFNNAGPCVAEDHYILDPLERIDAEEIEHLSLVQALKNWQEKKPDLFKKRVYKQAGLDR